jgi:hypothetical protein
MAIANRFTNGVGTSRRERLSQNASAGRDPVLTTKTRRDQHARSCKTARHPDLAGEPKIALADGLNETVAYFNRSLDMAR